MRSRSLAPGPRERPSPGDDIEHLLYEQAEEVRLLAEELADDNDSMARCHEEGWFHDDNDPDPW